MSVRRLLAALGALVLLAGCGGDPEPKVGSSPTSPTTSPTRSETAKPATAEDVIRQWAKMLLRVQNTGNTAQFKDAFPDCKECQKFAGQVESYYEAGGYVKAGAWHYNAITMAGHVGPRYEYNFRLHAEPTRYKTGADKPVQRLKGGVQGFRMFLRKSASGWTITDYQALTS